MGLSSSMNAGVMGLSVNSSKLATISDNIANSETKGYKRASIEFNSLVLTERPTAYDAGGVRASTIREIDDQGALLSTRNATDLAISGNGFLPVTDIADVERDADTLPLKLLRTGAFRPDQNGVMQTPAGLALLGWKSASDGSFSNLASALEPVQIDTLSLAAEPTQAVDAKINLNADADPNLDPPHMSRVEYFDTLGKSRSVDLWFQKTTTDNRWLLSVYEEGYSTDADTGQPTSRPTLAFQIDFETDLSSNPGGIKSVVEFDRTVLADTTVDLSDGISFTNTAVFSDGTNILDENGARILRQNAAGTGTEYIPASDIAGRDASGFYIYTAAAAATHGTTRVVDRAGSDIRALDSSLATPEIGTYPAQQTVISAGNGYFHNGVNVVDPATGAEIRSGGAPIPITDVTGIVSGVLQNTSGAIPNDAGGNVLAAAVTSTAPPTIGTATGTPATVNTTFEDAIIDPATYDPVTGEPTYGTADGDNRTWKWDAIPGDAERGILSFAFNGGEEIDITLGAAGSDENIVQFAAESQTLSITKDGSPTSTLTGIEIDETGLMDAIYDTGFRKTLYKIPIANVQNPNGMRTQDGQAFSLTRESGSVYFYDAGEGPTGALVSSALEESTTDVAEELTQLIKTQRAYSSNAKIIQTVDEMLQETTNLKR